MPIGFLTDADRDRLNRFPSDVAPADLLAYFTLSESDLELVQTHRGDHNRLGFAPDDLATGVREVIRR